MSIDFIVLILLYIVPSIFILRAAYKASKSGSMVKKDNGIRGGYTWEPSDVNVPFIKTGWFAFWVCLTIAYAILFALIAADFWDVWFEVK